MGDKWLQRTELFLSSERLVQIQAARVLVVGLGGVGSWAAEMLCRTGVGSMTLVDADIVDITNINRQMPALVSTIGKVKCEVVAARLREINPTGSFLSLNMFVDAENIPQLLDEGNYDFVVDAIDSLPQKAALIIACWERGIKIVSSLGAGAKGDLSCIRVGDLWRSEHCVLGKNLRRLLRDFRGKYKLPVVYSTEDARKQAISPSPDGGKPIIGTMSYYTTTFGCYLAAYVIENL
ncbi:MAG: tRNA threonylcarbamoyladenosine dehydratase [Bacteroidaceae bacterium]|nr:tRNA threonylcarbamoyladenosine dehydratase [Bacteroidaceae bacterium]